jgi:hypothetical protein
MGKDVWWAPASQTKTSVKGEAAMRHRSRTWQYWSKHKCQRSPALLLPPLHPYTNHTTLATFPALYL